MVGQAGLQREQRQKQSESRAAGHDDGRILLASTGRIRVAAVFGFLDECSRAGCSTSFEAAVWIDGQRYGP
eukprot:COSAG05_NODE_3206_length_2244_cov_8.618182_3_plen_71_part_00